MGLALKCTHCGTAGVSSIFYLGPDAHVCRACGAPFELADPAHDRRVSGERRTEDDDSFGAQDWRSGFDRRVFTAG